MKIDLWFAFRECMYALRNKNFRKSRQWWMKWYKVYKPYLHLDVNLNEGIKPSKIPIDIIIPYISKDFTTLSLVLSAARKNILHPISSIFIVSPENEEIQRFCKENNCQFVEETLLVGFSKKDIHYVVEGQDRSGWLLQQFIKLNGEKISTCKHFLVLDADTIISRPRKFVHMGRTILDFADEYHLPYYQTYEKLTGIKHHLPVSFISHCMLFEKIKLAALKERIEKNTGMQWDKAILALNKNEHASYFSEFETYANFVLSEFPGEFECSYWFNKALPRKDRDIAADLTLFRTEKVKSLSYHTYL